MKRSIFEVRLYNILSRRSFLSFVATLALMMGEAGAEPTTQSALPAGARLMTPVELYLLYRDKTWQWADGVGRMESQNRRFTARVDGKDGKVAAEGHWRITLSGKMCFDAIWRLEAGEFPKKTCFSHRVLDGTIYQKREPDGAWYVFKNHERTKTDEAAKLMPTETLVMQSNGLHLTQPLSHSPTQ